MKILQDSSQKVFRYKNGIKRKFKNKRVAIAKLEENVFHLEVLNFDKHEANEPSVCHKVKRGCIRVSAITLSRETLEAILVNGLEILNTSEK